MEGYKGLYGMHKYWGKKPFNEISSYIERFSKKGNLVLDCFAGSGITLIEAAKIGRKAYGVDLNPIATLLTEVSLSPVEIDLLDTEFERIRNELEEKIRVLYQDASDPLNNQTTHVIWEDGKPIEVWYRTPNSRKEIRRADESDLKMALEPAIAPKWYPTVELFQNSRINVSEGQKVADLFTPRALSALSHIYESVEAIENEDIKRVFKIVFTGALSQASRLVFVIRRRGKGAKENEDRAEVGSWVIGYWVPKEHFEINAWNCFENRFKRVRRGVSEVNELFGSDGTPLGKEVQVELGSATKISLQNDSVDYAFIDPPHANRVLYMEQSLMWNSWLKLENRIDWESEIIVSEASSRSKKDTSDYFALLGGTFDEIRRCLKKDHKLSIVFNSLDDDTWSQLINILIERGFELNEVAPLSYSASSVVQDNRANALKNDLVLTFSNTRKRSGKKFVFDRNSEILRQEIQKIINNNPDIEFYEVWTQLFLEKSSSGAIFKPSEILKEYNSMRREGV